MAVACSAPALLGGCSSYTGSHANQISQWASESDVTANNDQIVQDILYLRRSAAAGALRKLTTNCAGLSYDTGTAYGYLPTPDRVLTEQLNVAYVAFVNAGNSCAAVTEVGSPKVAAALRKISAGLGSLEAATRRLAAAGVH